MKIRNLFTPSSIVSLETDEVFVFGSNINGHHSGGAAKFAKCHFGAIEGQGEGLQGQSYAIPTAGRSLRQIKTSIRTFCDFAWDHMDLTFYVTEIGCKNAGFSVDEIAPLFGSNIPRNVILPKSFAAVILKVFNFDERNNPFHFELDGVRYVITDLYENKVCACVSNSLDSYNDGCMSLDLSKAIVYQGESYTIGNVEDDTIVFRRAEQNIYRCSNGTNFLGKGALFYNYSSETFHIPSSLEFYGAIPFPHCVVVSDSPRFEVKDGLVIDKKFKRVVQCINYMADYIVVPDGIEEIHDGAFFRCCMSSIKLPSSLKRINIDAFWECCNLKSIVIPENVEYIGDYCFFMCKQLKDFRMLGKKVRFGEFPFLRTMVDIKVD